MSLNQNHLALTTGEHVEVLRMAPEDACMKDMLVLVRWQGRKLDVPLSQLTPIDPDDPTQRGSRRLALLGCIRLPALIPRSYASLPKPYSCPMGSFQTQNLP